uniref:NADH dehydrogenase subunit 4L n=1 Tax=Sogatella furcifera TaxID=113103 RepID=M9Q275_SOGFU|nr:NADH dehydrogenase subunit 4L [Sogatella furcifera]AGH29095.1 NADH dehydrogenase subunit 4L [Sogatella furcifera]AGH29107.1 NADH dehydrogenase subunit 4L [Sogatella furcifera]QVO59333.1 NADH dehydrogenase subunit 4L [Sogatella furcifera]UXN45379.1 NADH dehydrogenase subunit 4L [Sogatella furcifera]UXN45392.1 NADH dehydrogenase subunit 4L [Sogatella furcifera]
MYLFFFMMFLNLICLVLVRKHYLMSLISLEFIFITLFGLLYFYLNFFMFEFSLGLIYLILGVIESSLGLSLLVYLVRKMNISYLSSFNLC